MWNVWPVGIPASCIWHWSEPASQQCSGIWRAWPAQPAHLLDAGVGAGGQVGELGANLKGSVGAKELGQHRARCTRGGRVAYGQGKGRGHAVMCQPAGRHACCKQWLTVLVRRGVGAHIVPLCVPFLHACAATHRWGARGRTACSAAGSRPCPHRLRSQRCRRPGCSRQAGSKKKRVSSRWLHGQPLQAVPVGQQAPQSRYPMLT